MNVAEPMILSERLEQIVTSSRRTITGVVYGYDPMTREPIELSGEEIEQMLRELHALRERNRRLAVAVLSGNSRAVYREYTRQFWPSGERDAN